MTEAEALTTAWRRVLEARTDLAMAEDALMATISATGPRCQRCGKPYRWLDYDLTLARHDPYFATNLQDGHAFTVAPESTP